MPELSTVRLNIALHGAVSGANVVLELDRYEIDNGIQVPTRYTTTVDDNGQASIDVWPNARGSRSSVYNVHISRRGQPLVTGTVALPELDNVNLHDYLESPPYPERPSYQSALIEIGELAASARDNAATADQRAADAVDAAESAAANQRFVSQQRTEIAEDQELVASDRRSAAESVSAAAESAASAAQAARQTADDRSVTSQASASATDAADRAEKTASRLDQLLIENNALRQLVEAEHGRPLALHGERY